ncbi:acyltransferase family protein [Pseudochryseolinea flava]|uniref:Acyltransferase n=1 Tax=Pseudochryseolinea flava TaxID=2059302 RepID=A0A364Y5V4_9BACT|nr:acyltransferase [Pseudochryseolinea flava]RAW02368.1 acyltransferase [Pseudochryseolinea flava]
MNVQLPNTKPHYIILDGLRGVAAITVVAFHILEAHATSHLDMMINHGYLAVDFFFLLSGFVIGYAYDDRWQKLSLGEFFKRRLIRLHPLIIFGMLVGAVCFYFQDSAPWPKIDEVPLSTLLVVMIIGFTLIPLPISMDIRGWQEMHPLNGPAWTLFFEYVANILYAVGLRRLPNIALAVLAVLAAGALIHLGLTNPYGDVIGGWSLDPTQLYIGSVRLLFPFLAGLLLSRIIKLGTISNAFTWCSLLLLIVLAMPRIGGSENLWMNGLYDSLTIILIFPIVIYLGASGRVEGPIQNNICKFLGDISYPIYITHYPLIYIYTGWVQEHRYSIEDTALVAVLVFVGSIALSYAALKLYDEPLRNWLTRKFVAK